MCLFVFVVVVASTVPGCETTTFGVDDNDSDDDGDNMIIALMDGHNRSDYGSRFEIKAAILPVMFLTTISDAFS